MIDQDTEILLQTVVTYQKLAGNMISSSEKLLEYALEARILKGYRHVLTQFARDLDKLKAIHFTVENMK
jgi:hypothetical protein